MKLITDNADNAVLAKVLKQLKALGQQLNTVSEEL